MSLKITIDPLFRRGIPAASCAAPDFGSRYLLLCHWIKNISKMLIILRVAVIIKPGSLTSIFYHAIQRSIKPYRMPQVMNLRFIQMGDGGKIMGILVAMRRQISFLGDQGFAAERPPSADGGGRVSMSSRELPPFRCMDWFAASPCSFDARSIAQIS